MSDIFDYATFFLASLLLVVLKFTGFVDWQWWVTAIPACLALTLHMITLIANR